jgi:hypothetical protein
MRGGLFPARAFKRDFDAALAVAEFDASGGLKSDAGWTGVRRRQDFEGLEPLWMS